MTNTRIEGSRRAELDTLRGVTLISMIVYHACWDLVYLFGMDWSWYGSRGAWLWQQSICWTFILLSGYCWALGRRQLRRGCTVFLGGVLISAVTYLFMPDSRIFFGVLSLLGSAMLLTVPLSRWLRRVPAWLGCVLSFALFCLLRGVSGGTVCFGRLALPAEWYRSLLTACLGFPPKGFYSADYFPLLPWLFLFWTGYYLYRLFPEGPRRQLRLPLVTAMGRHSLPIYLLHQPVVYAALYALRLLGVL
ncbi:MAG: heparan-alpha-glucosaminide N-acetyltransferase [Oscillospiraceae bacterium]